MVDHFQKLTKTDVRPVETGLNQSFTDVHTTNYIALVHYKMQKQV